MDDDLQMKQCERHDAIACSSFSFIFYFKAAVGGSYLDQHWGAVLGCCVGVFNPFLLYHFSPTAASRPHSREKTTTQIPGDLVLPSPTPAGLKAASET